VASVYRADGMQPKSQANDAQSKQSKQPQTDQSILDIYCCMKLLQSSPQPRRSGRIPAILSDRAWNGW